MDFKNIHTAEVLFAPAAYRLNKSNPTPYVIFSVYSVPYVTYKIMAGHRIDTEVGKPAVLYFYSEHNERTGDQVVCFKDPGMVEVFTALLTIQGMGFSSISKALSNIPSADSLRDVAREGDIKAINNMPGIGAKRAKVILDILQELFSTEKFVGGASAVTQEMKDAVEALAVLGYKKMEMNRKVADVVQRLNLTTTSEIVRAVCSGS